MSAIGAENDESHNTMDTDLYNASDGEDNDEHSISVEENYTMEKDQMAEFVEEETTIVQDNKHLNELTHTEYIDKIDTKHLNEQLTESDANDETVTLVYPSSELPLLSSNDDRLVNLVELSNIGEVGSQLELGGSTFSFGSTRVLLQQGFENDGQISIMTTDVSDNQLEFLQSRLEGNESVTFFHNTNPEENKSSSNQVMTDQLIHIPAGEVIDNGREISLPLSLVTGSKGNSILESLSNMPLSVGYDANNSDGPVVGLRTDLLQNRQSVDTQYGIGVSSLERRLLQRYNTSSAGASARDPAKRKSAFIGNVPKKAKSGQVGRPPKQDSCNKIIGSGASAISAEGVIQEINNRLVTVLPRPEDLKKLVDSKTLVFSLKRSGSRKTAAIRTKPFKKDPDILLPQVMLQATLAGDNLHEDDVEFKPHVNLKQYKKRGRRRKEKSSLKTSMVVSSSGKKPGRPRKVQTLVGGPHGPRIIHTGPNPSREKGSTSVDGTQSTESLARESIQETPLVEEKKPAEFDFFTEDLSKKVLPPRRRGTRYQQMLQALKTTEEENDTSTDEAEDISPDFGSSKHVLPSIRPKGTSGPGKRGRPRKSYPGGEYDSSLERSGTRIIQLSENLNPIETSSTSKVLVREGQDFEERNAEHKLIITFEQPETGEMVEQHVPVQNRSNNDVIHTHITNDPLTNISLMEDIDDMAEEDHTTIYVKEDGGYAEEFPCEECDDDFEHKKECSQHLKVKHQIESLHCPGKNSFDGSGLNQPYSCDVCGLGCSSYSMLKSHHITHTDIETDNKLISISAIDGPLDKQEVTLYYSCHLCSEIFESKPLLTQHQLGHDSQKVFLCDICKGAFDSSSGLNKHRKVHRISIEDPLNNYKCLLCHSNFTYKESVGDHMQLVHNQNPDKPHHVSSSSSSSRNEADVIARLQQKLSEGYAPKNSELYDVPNAEEIPNQSDKNPFLCGICNEAFTDIDLLCDHFTNSHTGNQNLYCEHCSVGCASEAQLDEHNLIHQAEEMKSLVPSSGSEGNWVCTYCGKCFLKSQELDKHTKLHTQRKTFFCDKCDASFLLKSTLEKHRLVHTGQRPYVCDICLKGFRQSASLIRHKLWTHSLKNQNKCDICTKTFFTETLLLFHLDAHGEAGKLKKKEIEERSALSVKDEANATQHDLSEQAQGKKFSCEYCDKVCSSLVGLLSHKLMHKRSGSYCCDECNRTFREKRYLKKHRLTHKGLKSWSCDICAKAFATKLTLIRHSQVHIREALRPDPNVTLLGDDAVKLGSTLPSVLDCTECNLSFQHKSHYVRHKLLHSGVPLLKCGLCDRMFVHKSDIIRHKVMHSLMFSCDICGRNFHKRSLYNIHKKRHLDGRPFKCDKCHKSFSSSGNYMTHMRIHSGEKPYKCNLCSYRCTQSGRLKRHKVMHYGLKPFACETCKKTFSTVEAMRAHARVHTGEKPFNCHLCTRSFFNKPSLAHHLKEHGREEVFKCDECEHEFRRQEHLTKHKTFHKMHQNYLDGSADDTMAQTVGNIPLYMCPACGRVFDKKKYLYTHQNVHGSSNKFSCDFCSKVLGSRMGLKNHMMIHSGQMPFKCNICGKDFRTVSNLNRHKKVHSTTESFDCDECELIFANKFELDEHKSSHVNLMLPTADNSESSVSQQMYVFLNDSMNNAMGQQQLLVENNQQFLVDGSQSILVFPEARYSDSPEPSIEPPTQLKIESMSPTHMEDDFMMAKEITEHNTATTIDREVDEPIPKPHQCDVCHKAFAKKQYLTKHKYRHRRVKPHACEVCGKRFAQKFEVGVHMMKHTGDRPFRCDVCQKDFRSRANLTNHKMRHTGEYPFMCSICDRGLSTQLQLEKHVSLHTGTYPYMCDYCHKGYATRVSLVRHLEKLHNITTQYAENDASTAQQIESLHAVSTITDSNDDKSVLTPFIKKEKDSEMEINVQNIDISAMARELEDTGFSVQVQTPYLKNCLLEEEQSEIEHKFLNSILQQEDESGPSDNHAVQISLLTANLDHA